MERKFSPSEFSNLVNASIHNEMVIQADDSSKQSTDASAVNGATESAITDDEYFDDLDDLDSLDNSDDFEDSLDDLDDLDDFNDIDSTANTVQGDVSTNSNFVSADKDFELSDFIKYKTLEQDTVSKIPDYDIQMTISAQTAESDVTNEESILQHFINLFNRAFMKTVDCNSMVELWNSNFIASKTTSEISAFMRLLAMFYHIDCKNIQVAEKIFKSDSVKIVQQLSDLNRTLLLSDVEIALGEREPDDSYYETEEAGPLIEGQQLNTGYERDESESASSTGSIDSYSDEYIDSGSDEISINASQTPQKLTKKNKLKAFSLMIIKNALSINARKRILGNKSILSSYENLTKLLLAGTLDPVEFTKFIMFLAQTTEIVVDASAVQEHRTFNRYFAALLARSQKIAIVGEDFYDYVFIINPNDGSVHSVTWDYVALNWRLIQLSLGKSSSVVSIPVNSKYLVVLQLKVGVSPKKMLFHESNSQLTAFAHDFTSAAMSYLDTFNTSDGFTWAFTDEDLKWYSLVSRGIEIPSYLKTLTKQQLCSFGCLLDYLFKVNEELARIVASGKLHRIYGVNICSLSNDPVFSVYQIFAYCLSTCGNVSVKLSKSEIGYASFLITGDGINEDGLEMTTKDFFVNYDSIVEHVQMSTSSEISIENGKFVIKFTK